MTKAEFLSTLQAKLMGEVATPEIESTIRYYSEYISEAVGQGTSEEDVINELGSPLLIAKTIIDTVKKNQMGQDSVYQDVSAENNEEDPKSVFKVFQESSLAAKVIVISALVVVVSIIFNVLQIWIPTLLPIAMVIFIIKIIRDKNRR